MVQVDLFLAYGIGGALAVSAGRQLSRLDNPFVSKYFVKSLLFLALVWAPSGLWLLLNHTSWETMQVAQSLYDIPNIIILGFGITNITQGILGWYVTYILYKKGKTYLAHLNWVAGFFCTMFILSYGWDGLGLDRFLYDEALVNGTPWTPGAGFAMGAGAFAFSSVVFTIMELGVFFLPFYLYLTSSWANEGARLDPKSPAHNKLPPLWKNMFGHLFFFFVGSFLLAWFAALTVNYTGKLMGVGDHVLRATGDVESNTIMHVLSYPIGIAIAIALLYILLFKPGRLGYHFLMNLTLEDTSNKETTNTSSYVINN